MKGYIIIFIVVQAYFAYGQSNDDNSTNNASQIPCVTSEQRVSITTLVDGFMVFETSSGSYWIYSKSHAKWEQLLNKETAIGRACYNNDTSENNERIKIGNASGVTVFEDDGTMVYKKNATVFEDLTIPVTSSKLNGSKEPAFDIVKSDGNKSHGVFTYWFDSDGIEELFFTVQIPHKRKLNTDIFPHIHWLTSKDLNGKKVRWSMEYVWANIGGDFLDTKITSNNEVISLIKEKRAYQHLLTDLGAISGANKGISSMLICRVFRDAEADDDDFDFEAGLLQIDFHYEVDTDGSRQLYSK